MSLRRERLRDLQALAGPVPLQQLIYATNISLRHRYVYVETPKCACSTIKRTLIGLELEDTALVYADPEDLHRREFSPLLNPLQMADIGATLNGGQYFRFCFVRNPYDRLLSAYLDKIASNRPENAPIKATLGLAADQTMSFAAFVDAVAAQPADAINPHWRPQFDQTRQETIGYDFIGRVEQFDADIARVGQRLNVDLGPYLVPERRRDTNAASRRDEFYTAALKDTVQTVYARDFAHFSYAI